MTTRRPSPRYASKAAVARLARSMREIGLDVEKCAVEFLPNGGIRFLPGAAQVGEVDTWDDL